MKSSAQGEYVEAICEHCPSIFMAFLKLQSPTNHLRQRWAPKAMAAAQTTSQWVYHTIVLDDLPFQKMKQLEPILTLCILKNNFHV